jgi:HEAT repeat protein
MSVILDDLKGGDRRSIGKSNLVVSKVLHDPTLFADIIGGISHANPLVRMRAADAAEKVSLIHPEWLGPYKNRLLELAAQATEQELRWHLAQMLPRLDLDPEERTGLFILMRSYLNDRSSIVRTFAMQALADLATHEASSRREIVPLFEELAVTGSPAVRVRARKLIALLRPAQRG